MTFKFGASNQALTLKLGLSLFSPWSPSTGEARIWYRLLLSSICRVKWPGGTTLVANSFALTHSAPCLCRWWKPRAWMTGDEFAPGCRTLQAVSPPGGGAGPCRRGQLLLRPATGELSAQHFLGKVILFSNAGTRLFLMAMLLISLRKQIALRSGENFWVAASYHPVAPAAESVLGTFILPRSFLGLTLYLLPQLLLPLTGICHTCINSDPIFSSPEGWCDE